MQRKVYNIQPGFRKMDGKIVKGGWIEESVSNKLTSVNICINFI